MEVWISVLRALIQLTTAYAGSGYSSLQSKVKPTLVSTNIPFCPSAGVPSSRDVDFSSARLMRSQKTNVFLWDKKDNTSYIFCVCFRAGWSRGQRREDGKHGCPWQKPKEWGTPSTPKVFLLMFQLSQCGHMPPSPEEFTPVSHSCKPKEKIKMLFKQIKMLVYLVNFYLIFSY